MSAASRDRLPQESRLDGDSSSHLDPHLSAENLHGIGKKRSRDCLPDSSGQAAGLPPDKHVSRPTGMSPAPSDSDQDQRGVTDKDELVSAWLSSLVSDPDSPPEREASTQEQSPGGSLAAMDLGRDSDGFVVPPIPSLPMNWRNVDTVSDVGGSARSAAKSLAEDPLYRLHNLMSNRIHLRPTFTEWPASIAALVRCVEQDRDSPGPSIAQLENDAALQKLENGAIESGVEQYLSGATLPAPGLADIVTRTDRQPMAKQAVPQLTGAMYSVSNPAPDMLYGYSVEQLAPRLLTLGGQPFANTANLVYPFLAVELKGEGGSLWVATNQCLGAASACVNMVEQLHKKCQAYHVDGLSAPDRAVFSVATSGTEARVHVSWLDTSHGGQEDYNTQKIRSFCLQEPGQHIAFRRCVRNIVDWGAAQRLEAIKAALVRLTDSEEYKAAVTLAAAEQPRSRSRSRSLSDSGGRDSSRKRQRV